MNANDYFTQYTGTENYYQYIGGLLLTDGTKAMADMFQCYWLLDIIASYFPQLKVEEFQVWIIDRKDNETSATVHCTNGNDRTLAKQHIPYTDFKANTATLWLEFNVILLPSEH